MNWPTAFALTAAIELPLVAAVAPSALRRRAALDSLAVNLLTHPLAWLSFGAGWLPWATIELLVLAVEAIAYRTVTRLSWPRALAASALANGVTAALSFAV